MLRQTRVVNFGLSSLLNNGLSPILLQHFLSRALFFFLLTPPGKFQPSVHFAKFFLLKSNVCKNDLRLARQTLGKKPELVLKVAES